MNAARILIVEDEGVVAKDIEGTLQELGYEVCGWETSGEGAIESATAAGPDLVLMDIRLKGDVDGVEAAERIRGELGIPVVFLTAYADEETLGRAMVADPFGYVVKPFSERELQTAVSIALYKHGVDSELRRREEQLSDALRRLEATNEELLEQRGFLGALFENAPCSVAVLDPDLRVRMANRHFVQTFGITADTAASGVELASVLRCPYSRGAVEECGGADECSSCRIVEHVKSGLAGREIFRRRCLVDWREDGHQRQLTLLVSATPLRYQGEELAIVILEDITELSSLRRLMGGEKSFSGIVGKHPLMLEIYDTIREIADVNVPVMILGESGTGKELVARAIHNEGERSRGNFVPVNCGALPDGLLESELFGHVKGAFTGAVRDRKGRFELADGGSIFLDEVGDLSAAMQVKLLRVLQEGTFERVGSERTVTVDARVICATNRNLEEEVEEGRFREDLFYRLCVVPIRVPPLRDRVTDVPLLAEHIVERETVTTRSHPKSLSEDLMNLLMSHEWPGNVRELQNALQYALIKCKGDVVDTGHLPPKLRREAAEDGVRKVARRGSGLTTEKVLEALREADDNRTRAAELLGVSRATLYRFMADSPDW